MKLDIFTMRYSEVDTYISSIQRIYLPEEAELAGDRLRDRLLEESESMRFRLLDLSGEGL